MFEETISWQSVYKRNRGKATTSKSSQEDCGDDIETPSHGPKSISMSASNLETHINTTSSISNSKVENIPTDS